MDVIRYINSLDLQLDERHRGNCPRCNGRNTFTVTKKVGTLLYNCYKADCKLGGVTGQRVSLRDIQNRNKESDKIFTMPDYVTPVVDSNKNSPTFCKFSARYGLNLNEINLYYDIKEHRIVFPILHNYNIVDAAGRAVNSIVRPKWKRYGSSGYGCKMGEGNIAVVVEDCISAAVVSTTFNNCVGFALLGTNFMTSYYQQLHDIDAIIIALDPDASNKSIAMKREISTHIPAAAGIFTFKLEDDLKYRKKHDINGIENKLLEIRNGMEGEDNGTSTTTHVNIS